MLFFIWSESCGAERRGRTVSIHSRIQNHFPVSLKRFEPDILDRQSSLILNIEFAPSLSLADFDPVGRVIARASETRNLTEGLEQYRTDGVTLLPVLGQPALAACQNMRGQIWNAGPRQNQKACIVRHQLQVAPSTFGRPADEAVARRGLPDGGTKSEQRQRLPTGDADEVSDLRPEQRIVTEIMITLDKCPGRRARAGLDHLELQRLHFRQCRGQLELRRRPIGLRQVGAGSARAKSA